MEHSVKMILFTSVASLTMFQKHIQHWNWYMCYSARRIVVRHTKFPENSFKMIQNSFKTETETQGVGINLQEDTWFHQNWN